MGSDFTPPEELLALLAALADGLLTDEEGARLAGILQADPAARAFYVRYAQLLGSLHWEYAGAAVSGDSAAVTDPAGPVRRGRGLPRVLLAAASVLLCAAGFLLLRPGPSPGPAAGSPPAVATLIRAEGARWGGAGASPAAGDRVGAGRLVLAAGAARLRFDGGADVTLFGPAELAIESGQFVFLHSGRVTVRAPEKAIGFTVKTRAARLTDLGTEFGVSVGEDDSSEVHVFEGVVVARPTASDVVIPLLRREAARIDVERGDLVTVPADAGKFPGVEGGEPDRRPAAPPGRRYPPLPAGARVVFVGDRTTDRETHLLLLQEAFRGLPAAERPALFNAGESCRFAFGEDEFRQNVLALRPTHAVLEFGSEVALSPRPKPAAEFRDSLVRFLGRLEQAGVEPILRTAHPLLPTEPAEARRRVAEYNGVIRAEAERRGLRLADAEPLFRAAGVDRLLADNGRCATFAGHREMARSLLHAFGRAELAVPDTLELSLLPGVVTEWRVRVVPEGEPLDAPGVAAPEGEGGWAELTLPQPDDPLLRRHADASHTITYRDRARGFATDLNTEPGRCVQGVAWVDSPGDCDVFLNTGATLRAVWVNGEKVFDAPRGWTGWHAGKERVPVHLRAGRNRVVIEARDSFFLSLTAERDWPLP